MSPESLVAIRPGRVVGLGPDWIESDATLAFDASSGDYWVLDGLGRFLVERLLAGGPLPAAQLSSEVAGTPAIAHAAGEVHAALTGLLDAGLIQDGIPASS